MSFFSMNFVYQEKAFDEILSVGVGDEGNRIPEVLVNSVRGLYKGA